MRRQLIRYLARVFVAGPRVDVSSAGMAQLAYALGNTGLVPSTGQQGGAPRALLVSANQEFLLAVNSEGFDLQFAPVDGKTPSISFADFCQRAAAWTGGCLKFVNQSAHRISAVREQLLLELDDAEHRRARTGLLHLPSGLEAVEPFQWDFRLAIEQEQEIAGTAETLYIVPTVKRISAIVGADRHDALFLTTDLNTTPKSTVARFDPAAVREFFDNSPEWHDRVERSILEATGLA